MSKQLRKTILTRTRLLNKYKKDNSAGNFFAYKRQINFCVKLIRKSKKNFYNNLNVKRITYNKKIWQTIKPNCTDKTHKDERITLVEGDKVITEEKDVVKIFKDDFEKIVKTLKIDRPILSDLSDNPVLNAIEKFSPHASVLKIKEARNSSDWFSFKDTHREKHPKIKPQRLRKIQILTFRSLVHQINSFSEVLKLE